MSTLLATRRSSWRGVIVSENRIELLLRDVERQQIDLDALSRLSGKGERARSRPDSPGCRWRAEETGPASSDAIAAAGDIGPDDVVADRVSLSLHSPESSAYNIHREKNRQSAVNRILFFHYFVANEF